MSETPRKTTDRDYYLFAMRIFADFGATIAIPAVLGALAGRWCDARFGTHPLFLTLFLLTAFLLTVLLVQRKSQRYGREYQALINKEKNK